MLKGKGWVLTDSAPLIVPHDVAGSMYRSENVQTGGEMPDGNYALYAQMAISMMLLSTSMPAV